MTDLQCFLQKHRDDIDSVLVSLIANAQALRGFILTR